MLLDPWAMLGNAVAGFTSVKGRSHTFDARADGYARGEAIDALVCLHSEGDRVVRLLGSAVRHDGRSASLTAPNGHAQQLVLLACLADAGTVADQVAALEAHGTGTILGDPIEAGAATRTLQGERRDGRLVVGSLKANAGHTEPGAGVAGVLRLLAELQGAWMAPNAQLRVLNPHVGSALGSTSFALPVQVGRLPYRSQAGGVSSFGYSGTIAHALLRREASFGHAPDALPPLAYRRLAFMWRQTPHPFAQLQPTSPSDGVTLFRSPAAGALHALVADHAVQGRIIFPAAGYLELARAASAGAAQQGVLFLQPLTLESPELVVDCVVAVGRFEVRSGEGSAARDTATHCSGALASSGGWYCLSHVWLRGCSCASAVSVGALYAGFNAVGLQYGPSYRTLMQAWAGTARAAALLRVRSTQQGTQVHPADLDDALCMSALAAPSGGGGETRLPFAVDGALLQGAPGQLRAVRRRRCACVPLLTSHAGADRYICVCSLAGRVAAGQRDGLGAPRFSCSAAAGAAGRLQVASAACRGNGAAPPLCDRVAHAGGERDSLCIAAHAQRCGRGRWLGQCYLASDACAGALWR